MAFVGASVRSENTETNVTYLQVLQASNNVPQTLEVLPKVEALWPDEPELYLRSVNVAAHTLGAASSAEAQKSFLNLFTTVMQKSFPTNENQVGLWVELKTRIISFYLNFNQIKNDPSHLVDVAKFIGDIRMSIIPGYTNQAITLSGLMLGQPEKVQDLVEKNRVNERKDKLQNDLRSGSTKLTSLLISNCSRLVVQNHSEKKFIDQIVAVAHLTDEERKKIQRKD